jgi:hypothetical protein
VVVPEDERMGDRGHRLKLAGWIIDSRPRASAFIIL